MKTITLSCLSTPEKEIEIECRVYRNQASMFAAVQACCGNRYDVPPNITAYSEGERGFIPDRLLAIVFLCEDSLSEGVVAHEMFHVAAYQMCHSGRKQLKLSLGMATGQEEEHATMIQFLVDDFYKQYKKTI